MFQAYLSELKELRYAIRKVLYQKILYDKCNVSYREHLSIIKKTETKLKKVGSGRNDEPKKDLHYIFNRWLGTNKIRTKHRRQEILTARLSQIASLKVADYLKQRIDDLSKEKRLLKGLEGQEAKVITKLGKKLQEIKDPKVASFMPFIINTENLSIDLKEIKGTLLLGEMAHKKLTGAIKIMKSLSETNADDFATVPQRGEWAYAAFSECVEAYMNLCAFRNELSQYVETRDLQLHMDTIPKFMSTLINQLILDWTESKRFKLSLFHIRKTVNMVEALLQGLNVKKNKVEGELAITTQELNAITKRLITNTT
jgi:hypothetical protein